MQVYVMNFVDAASVEAEMDDPTFEMEYMSCPQFYGIYGSLETALCAARVGMREETFNDDGLPERFTDPVHTRPKDGGRENWTFDLFLGDDDTPSASAVIQLVEVQ